MVSSVRKALRRLHRELVRGRAKVRVVSAESTRLSCKPIFLIGVYRSGTTLVRYIIDSHSRICCPPESKFVRFVSEMLTHPGSISGFDSLGYDEEHVVEKTRNYVSYFFDNYAKAHDKVRWADKTPSYLSHLPSIDKLFPDAQYIMIYRHGLDVANSITKSGQFSPPYLEAFKGESDDPRVTACAYWCDAVGKMQSFQRSNPERCHAVRYEDLCRNPEPLLKKMFSAIDEPWEPQVLQFYKFRHDIGFEDGKIQDTTGFEISEGNYRAWPEEIIRKAGEAAEPALSQLGYKVDHS